MLHEDAAQGSGKEEDCVKKPAAKVLLIWCACILSLSLRIVPLPFGENFSALGALALLCGALIRNPVRAIAVVLACRAVTDLWLEAKTGYGFYHSMAFDYAAYAIIGAVGRLLGSRYRLAAVAGGFLAGAIFFIVSNFGVWFLSPDHRYSSDVSGLLECFRLAVPFARGTFQGDILFALAFFSAASLAFRVDRVSIGDEASAGASAENC